MIDTVWKNVPSSIHLFHFNKVLLVCFSDTQLVYNSFIIVLVEHPELEDTPVVILHLYIVSNSKGY
jgi:hypothetical protein